MRMLGRVNQDDTVLVEQQFVPLHRDDEVGLAFRVFCAFTIARIAPSATSRCSLMMRSGAVSAAKL
jgi:hypothetical protein